MISNLDRVRPAHSSGLLQIGDAILSVNGHSLSGKAHKDAVQLLKSAGNTLQLKVAFIVGVPPSEEGESTREKERSEEFEINCEVPPKVAIGLPPSSSDLQSNRSSDTSIITEQPPPDSPQNAPAKPPFAPGRVAADAPTSDNDSTTAEEDTAQTNAQRLVPAFHLSPNSPEQLPLSHSEDADIAMFWYDQPDEPASSPSASVVPSLHVSSVTHLLRVAGPPTVTTPPTGQAAVPTPSAMPTATPTSAVTPVITSITTPTETSNGNQLPKSPKESVNSSYHMTLTAVPIQNMQIPTISDSDDVPLFSI